MSEHDSTATTVPPGGAKQDASAPADLAWIDRSIWTDRMLTALVNGVKGRTWFSLIDKVYRPLTLSSAWLQVYRNQGAAGIDKTQQDTADGR